MSTGKRKHARTAQFLKRLGETVPLSEKGKSTLKLEIKAEVRKQERSYYRGKGKR